MNEASYYSEPVQTEQQTKNERTRGQGKMREYWGHKTRHGLYAFLFALNFVFFAGSPLCGWGPITHMVINIQAYDQVSSEPGNTLAIPVSLKKYFVAAGPAPDVKLNAGDAFPRDFHFDLETVRRMIELAKANSRFGWTDLAMGLGWAAHLFAEITTAHTGEGYPNAKITVNVPEAEWLNHQLNELVVDILAYREYREILHDQPITMPIRLLESAMQAEQLLDSEKKTMTVAEIRAAGNAFLPTALGVRVIADYLMSERPELLDEMEAFYGDRGPAIQKSVDEVVAMLKECGTLEQAKKMVESADTTQKIRISLSGTIADRAKKLAVNALGGSLKTGKMNDIFSYVAYHTLGGIITSGFRERLLQFAQNVGGKDLQGDERHLLIVNRFVEGILCRHDLTYPEILAYVLSGLETDKANSEKQQHQFTTLCLCPDGRKPVDSDTVQTALSEVERIEQQRNKWPWFWPFRPSEADLTVAREKAGRVLAYYFLDHATSATAKSQASKLLESCRNLRTLLWEEKSTSWLNPLQKMAFSKNIQKTSQAVATQEGLLKKTFSSVDKSALASPTANLYQTSALAQSLSADSPYSDKSLSELQTLYQKAYANYVGLLRNRPANTEKIKEAVADLRAIVAARHKKLLGK